MAVATRVEIKSADETKQEQYDQEREERMKDFIPFFPSAKDMEASGIAFAFVYPPMHDNDQTHIGYTVQEVGFFDKSLPKPANLSGYSLSLPMHTFENGSDDLDPMTYVKNNPNLSRMLNNAKNDNGEPITKMVQKRKVTFLVRASEFFPVDSVVTSWKAKENPITDRIRAWTLDEDKFQQIRDIVAEYAKEVGVEEATNTIYILRRIKTGKATNSAWGFNWAVDTKNKVPDYRTLTIDKKAEDYIAYASFDSQKKMLANLGINLPYDDPDKKSEDTATKTEEE